MIRLIILPVILFLSTAHLPIAQKFTIDGRAQGTTYHIAYYFTDSIATQSQIDSILDKLDSSLSLYKPYSLVNQFNASPQGLFPDRHLSIVVRKAIQTFHATNGLFDITVFPLTDAWGFGPRKISAPPDLNAIRKLLPCVNGNLLFWQGRRLVKKKNCIQLDPNGIAQGYSVDVIANFLEAKGIRNYIVELGGEIRVKGRKLPGNEKMSIGIEAPSDELDSPIMERIIYADNGAITTSGNYRRYYESDGRKISHLLNPRTGFPIQNELISVTLYAPDALTADAYDNALMGMGLVNALKFVEKRKNLAAHFIFRRPDGSTADTMSRRFHALLKP